MENSINLPLKAIQHIGIPVTDIRRSESFYSNLGFKNVMEAPFLHEGEKGTCIMMQQNSIIIELYQMPGKTLQEIASRKDGHVDHVAFDVQDIDEVYKTLSSAGYRIIEPAPVFLQFWKNGTRFFNILGPDNERLEFNQVL